MGVDKVVLRAFLNSLAAIAALIAFMLLVLIGVYPSTMMEIAYDLGMDSSSIRYAERAYGRSDDEYFMSYALEVAIGLGDDEKIVSCGEKLIADEQFADYCRVKNENLSGKLADDSFVFDCVEKGVDVTTLNYMGYAEYVYGQVCVATYETGEKEKAIERAFALTFQSVDGQISFAQNNAVVAVLYTALGDKDVEIINMIKGKMQQQSIESLSLGDKAYFDWAFALTNG